MIRSGVIERKTKETDIYMKIKTEGVGSFKGDTGIGFFNHMLNSFARYGFFDIELKITGDLEVDCHHTIEDVGIVLGQCIGKICESKEGIKRIGTSFIPMDETLARCSIDLSGRSFLVFNAEFSRDNINGFDLEMVEEFFGAVSSNAKMNLHNSILYGTNNHHMVEALFKAFGRALSEAISDDIRVQGVLSTKGCI
ncbi:MAG: imidazoleglycerol-phosphate dehydratase HisB [Clostridiaceae bacterium]